MVFVCCCCCCFFSGCCFVVVVVVVVFVSVCLFVLVCLFCCLLGFCLLVCLSVCLFAGCLVVGVYGFIVVVFYLLFALFCCCGGGGGNNFLIPGLAWARLQAPKELCHPLLSVCAVFSCVQIFLWLPVLGIFNVRTDVDAGDSTRGLCGHGKRVCLPGSFYFIFCQSFSVIK